MTRSIFDPMSGETEHSGNQNMGPAADNNSQMPPSVVDGKVSEEEVAEQESTQEGLPEGPGVGVVGTRT